MEYYSTITRNVVLIHAATWMNLESIMLGDIKLDTKGARIA